MFLLLLFIVVCSGATSMSSSPQGCGMEPVDDREVLWIDKDTGAATLVSLSSSKICSLPSYPGIYGTVVLTYMEEQNILVGCGREDDLEKHCYLLSPDKPAEWQVMPGWASNDLCLNHFSTKGNYYTEMGWLVMGQEELGHGLCGYGYGFNIATALLTTQAQWIEPPITSPYSDGFPADFCSVAINSSAVIVTGGADGGPRLSSTWLLDLTDYTWLRLQDMPGPRCAHGCTITSTGELMIAGGNDGSSFLSSVYTYNLMSNTWTQAADLPSGMNDPVMFLWKNTPIFLEHSSSNIWRLENNEWLQMSSDLGATFDADEDSATLLPSGLFKCG